MDFTKWHQRYCTDSRLKYPSIKTQENYQCSVGSFLKYFQKEIDPQHIKTEQIKEWLLTFQTVNTRNHKLCAVKSFYEITVGMPLKLDKIPFSKKDKKLPEVLEENEISAILSVCTNLKHKTIICLLYGCGLRISEVINLKLEHIRDTTLDIKLAKGRKDRIVPYPNYLKSLVDTYINEYQPVEYLFNGQFPNKELRYSERSINEFLKQLAAKSGIKRRVHAHLFRHSWATHSLEQGVSLPFIQTILGHNNPKTTSIYLHASRKSIERIPSPLLNLL